MATVIWCSTTTNEYDMTRKTKPAPTGGDLRADDDVCAPDGGCRPVFHTAIPQDSAGSGGHGCLSRRRAAVLPDNRQLHPPGPAQQQLPALDGRGAHLLYFSVTPIAYTFQIVLKNDPGAVQGEVLVPKHYKHAENFQVPCSFTTRGRSTRRTASNSPLFCFTTSSGWGPNSAFLPITKSSCTKKATRAKDSSKRGRDVFRICMESL